jgi:hypothetical protein
MKLDTVLAPCLPSQVPDPKLKYQQLLAYAKKLPPMPADLHTEDNKVRGCVSQVRAAGHAHPCWTACRFLLTAHHRLEWPACRCG